MNLSFIPTLKNKSEITDFVPKLLILQLYETEKNLILKNLLKAESYLLINLLLQINCQHSLA